MSTTPGEAIRVLEPRESGSHLSRDAGHRPVMTPFIEFWTYFVVVVVGLSSVFLLGHDWSRVSIAGHVSVALLITVAALVGGYLVARIGDAGARRVSGFLRLVGTAGAALATDVSVGPTAKSHLGLTLLCVGVVVCVVSALLWRNLDRSLQFLSAIVGLVMTLGAVGTVAHLHASPTEVAWLVWLLAIAVGLMGLQMLRPALTALLVAEVGSLVGAFALSFPNHLAGVLLGLLSASGAVGVGFGLRRPPIIVCGAVGFFMFDFRIFAIYVRSADAALVAFILGFVLVGLALVREWRTTTNERRQKSTQLDVHVDVEWYEPW